MSKSEKKQDASITWFEIPADDPERATAFSAICLAGRSLHFPVAAITGTSIPVAQTIVQTAL